MCKELVRENDCEDSPDWVFDSSISQNVWISLDGVVVEIRDLGSAVRVQIMPDTPDGCHAPCPSLVLQKPGETHVHMECDYYSPTAKA